MSDSGSGDCCTNATNILTGPAGKVVAVDSGAIAPVSFFVDGNVNTFHDLKAIVTSIGVQGQPGYQFMHALREFIYVYVFTERIGEFVINGIAFPDICNYLSDTGVQNITDNFECVYGMTGLERVITWYECNRITTRGTPIVISLGELAYEAFLVSMKADIISPDTGLAQFSYRFNFVPNISDSDAFCFPFDESCLDVPCSD